MLILRYEYEKIQNEKLSERQLEEMLTSRGSDYTMIRYHHKHMKCTQYTDTGTQNRCLLHKPYVNEVNLSRQNPPLKCC